MTHHFRKHKSMYKIVNRYNYIDTSPGHYGPTQVNTMLRKKTISRIIIDIQTGLLKYWYFSRVYYNVLSMSYANKSH